MKTRFLLFLAISLLLIIGFSFCKKGSPTGPDGGDQGFTLFLENFNDRQYNFIRLTSNAPVVLADTYTDDGKGGYALRRHLETGLFNPFPTSQVFEMVQITGLDTGSFRIRSRFRLVHSIDNNNEASFGIFFANQGFLSSSRIEYKTKITPLTGQTLTLDTVSAGGAPSHKEVGIPGSFDPYSFFTLTLDGNPSKGTVNAVIEHSSGSFQVSITDAFPGGVKLELTGLDFGLLNTPGSSYVVDVDDFIVQRR
jgi:hypothetical protein